MLEKIEDHRPKSPNGLHLQWIVMAIIAFVAGMAGAIVGPDLLQLKTSWY